MRFGLLLPTQGPYADVRLLAALAHDADQAGWDGVFIWDELLAVAAGPGERFAGWDGVADSWVALTAIAAATERIRIGALVSPVARMRPETFALQTATLDRFSNGRLIIGAGLGNPPDQFSAFGYRSDLRVRAAMVDEFLDLVTLLWIGDPVDFHGQYYEANNATLRPTPLQQPRIPIWIGADSGNRTPRRRGARWDGFAPVSTLWPDGILSADEYCTIVADVLAQRASETPFDFVAVGNAEGTKPRTDELADYEAAGVTWMLEQSFDADSARDRILHGPPGF